MLLRLVSAHKIVTKPEIIDQIHELILEDCQILAKSVAEQMGISREQVGSIIHEDLDIQKLSVKLVLKCLNADQKFQQCQLCIELCGENVEYIPILVAAACFLPGQAKDLSAPPPTLCVSI